MDKTAVLLGLFDGLHRGHRRAADELMKYPGKKTVYTFDSLSLRTKGRRGLLMTDSAKREGLLRLGADCVISEDFENVRDMGAEEFVRDVLIGRLCAESVICGENFRFAKGCSADAEDLKAICASFGIDAKTVPTVYDGGEAISTTRIRGLIEAGDISSANRLLGYDYGYEGEVEHGFRIGSQMGIKTLNLPFDPVLVLPKKGVYASRVITPCGIYKGVTNIGTRPTVHGSGETVIETHMIGFDGDLYGKKVRIALLEFMRPEVRFESIEELKKAVGRDIEHVAGTVEI